MARPEREESVTLHGAEKQPLVHQLEPVTPMVQHVNMSYDWRDVEM